MNTPGQESLETLVMVSRLLSSKLELSELLNTVMQLASRVVGSERASLSLLDETTHKLYFDVAIGLGPEVQKISLNLGEGIAGTCAKDGKSLIINDATNDPRHSNKVDEESGFVTRSILACPMILKGHVLGVVQAINHIDGPFTEKDQRNFEAFAAQAAIAIENARLFSSIREEKRRLQNVFKQTKEGAVLTDPEGNILLINESARAYLDPETSFLKNIKEALSGLKISPDLPGIIASASNVVQLEITREKPKKLILDGSAIRLFAQKKDGKSTEPEGWLWLFRDVTSQRMEEGMTRNFLSLISHKLKTPLASINGYSQILVDEGKDGKFSEFAGKAACTIYQQGIKLTDLVDRLLSYVTIDELTPATLKKSSFDVSALAGEAISVMKPRFESLRGVKIEFANAGQLTVTGDPYLMKDVFRNIIDNAVKFNPAEEKLVLVSCGKKDNLALISFGDNGPGIPPEELETIFHKFYQVESSFTGQVEGWGLGLAFVKRVVEAHGGKILVKSQLQKGSVFTVVLPLTP
ncbi:MAG: ATP-binding protein [bacterium]